MKYVIIIPDGAADVPLEELDGLTPLEAASIPTIDALAAQGRLGTVANVPDDQHPGSDIAILSVLGYNPADVYTGRAPLEAAAQGLEIDDDQWVFRCNLVTIIDEVMEDYCAGHISTPEATALIDNLKTFLDSDTVQFHPGVAYRHLLTVRGDIDVETTPPHDILGQPIANHLPTGEGAEQLEELASEARVLLGQAEINAVRRDLGENPATDIWLWGQGKMPTIPSFQETYGLRGAAITAVDLIRGISNLIGWDVIEVEGATGYVDTNYQGKGQAAIEAIDKYDIVLVHVEGTDEAGHNADVAGKVFALGQIDEHIVKPVLEKLQSMGDDWRLMVLPDHPTPCTIRTHTREPVPFVLAGKGVEAVRTGAFTEQSAIEADLHVDRGHTLMEYFLTVR